MLVICELLGIPYADRERFRCWSDDVGHLRDRARAEAGLQQRERLMRDPALVQPAIEELLRLAAPSQTKLPRCAQANIQLEGVTIHAGDAVLPAIAAANRDPRVFRDPDRFDIVREPNPHVAFGYGGHYCLGASLARLELRAVVGSLFRRLPGPRLAVPIEQLRLRRHLLTGGIEALPVGW